MEAAGRRQGAQRRARARRRAREQRPSSPATTRRRPISRTNREPASRRREHPQERHRRRGTRITRHPGSRPASPEIRRTRTLEAQRPSLRAAPPHSHHEAVSNLRLRRLRRQAALNLRRRGDALACCYSLHQRDFTTENMEGEFSVISVVEPSPRPARRTRVVAQYVRISVR